MTGPTQLSESAFVSPEIHKEAKTHRLKGNRRKNVEDKAMQIIYCHDYDVLCNLIG